MPIRIDASPREITGVLWFARAGRTFEDDEIALIAELIAKVELSAADIIAHHTIREQALTDPLTGLGNRRKLGAELESAFARARASRCSCCSTSTASRTTTTRSVTSPATSCSHALAAKLRRAVDGHGRAYRLGGDEFCAHLDLDGQDADRDDPHGRGAR